MKFYVVSIYDRSVWVAGTVWWSMWSRDKAKARTFPTFKDAAETAHRECCADPHDYAIVSEAFVPGRDAEARVS